MSKCKACKNCEQIQPLEAFPKHKQCLDGHANVCKKCKLAKEKIRKAANPDFYKAKAAANRKANHKKRMDYQRNWRLKNLEKYRESARKLYWENPEKYRERRKQYSINHPEIDRANNRKRKAKLHQVVSEPYTTDEVLLRYGSDCYLCNEPIDLDAPRWTALIGWERGLHLDHVIPLSKNGANTIDNVRPTHGLCNIKKQAN